MVESQLDAERNALMDQQDGYVDWLRANKRSQWLTKETNAKRYLK